MLNAEHLDYLAIDGLGTDTKLFVFVILAVF